MTTSMHEKIESANFLVAAFAERDRKLRVIVLSTGVVAAAFILALTIASIQAGMAASHARAETNEARALLDSMTGVLTTVEWSYQRALAIDEKALGPRHPDVARDLNGLATLYIATGRYLDLLVEDAGALRFRERLVVCDSSRVDTLLAIPL